MQLLQLKYIIQVQIKIATYSLSNVYPEYSIKLLGMKPHTSVVFTHMIQQLLFAASFAIVDITQLVLLMGEIAQLELESRCVTENSDVIALH